MDFNKPFHLSEHTWAAFFNGPDGAFVQVIYPTQSLSDGAPIKEIVEFTPDEIRNLSQLFREWERSVLSPPPDSLTSV